MSPLIELGLHDHACLLYESWSEQEKVATAYFQQGIKKNERCIYLADENDPSCVYDVLITKGLDPNGFEVGSAEKFYMPDGHFELHTIKNRYEHFIKESILDGYSGMRVMVEMTWSIGRVSAKKLNHWECCTGNLYQGKLSSICQYNITKFSKTILNQAVKCHPYIFNKSKLTMLPFVS